MAKSNTKNLYHEKRIPDRFFNRDIVDQNQLENREIFSPNIAGGRADLGFSMFDTKEEVRVINLAPGSDIQKALNQASLDGGGVVKLKPATYTLADHLSIPGGVMLQGASRDNVIIECGAYSVKIQGSNSYSTGTAAVTQGSTTVTGTGTTWTEDMVGQYIRLYDDYYEITARASNTSITIGSPFAASDISGAAYVIADLNWNAIVSKLTIQNSTGIGLDVTQAYEPIIDDIIVAGCETGMDFDDVIAPKINVFATASDVNLKMDYTYSFRIDFSGFVDSVDGPGVELTNCGTSTFFDSGITGNDENGITMTGCNDIAFLSVSSGSNGGHGLEMVSGCNDNQFIGFNADGNTNDNIKFTATCDRNVINDCSLINAGGYGINIAASTCDNNILGGGISFNNNTSGNVNDSGTNTEDRTEIAGNQVVIKTQDAGEAFTGATSPQPSIFGDGATTITLKTSGTAAAQFTMDTTKKLAFSYTPSVEEIANVLTYKYQKDNACDSDAIMTIQGDSSGTPDGIPLASGTIANSDMSTGSKSEETALLDSAVILSASTKYWVVIEMDDTSEVDPIYLDYAGAGSEEVGTFDGSTWSTDSSGGFDGSIKMRFIGGSAYKSDANVSGRDSFHGFVTTTTAVGSKPKVVVNGTVSGFSGLTPGAVYYVSNTAGQISTSAGATSIQVGIALSATTLLIDKG